MKAMIVLLALTVPSYACDLLPRITAQRGCDNPSPVEHAKTTPESRGKLPAIPDKLCIGNHANAEKIAALEAEIAKLKVGGTAGPQGPAGPIGPQGPAGKDGNAADVSALLNEIKELRKDLITLQTQVNAQKADVDSVRANNANVLAEIAALKKQFANGITIDVMPNK